jgi:ribonuclease Z
MNLNITGYSTALFSTWYFIEELGLLLDAGDGLMSGLLQKSRKIDNVFITHADRDHLTGLLQFTQLNARQEGPSIHYPKDCGSFPFLEEFSKRFDPHVSGTIWKPLVNHERVWIRKDVFVEAIRNNHVAAAEHLHKSFGYKVVQVKHKLKQEYLDLPKQEIKKIIDEKGKENTHDEIHTALLCYSGDTPVENFEHWNGAEILIHEATFLGGPEDTKIHTHGNKHSQLEDVIRAVAEIKVGKLILGHFSSRYTDEQIDGQIKELMRKYKMEIPVFRVLPGKLVRNILNDENVNS